MHRDVRARATRRLAGAAASMLVPALLLGYMGVRALAERANNLRTTYTATVALVRDRLTTELTHLESEMASDLARLDESFDNPAAARAWLRELTAARPWLASPFLLQPDGGVMTGDLGADWSRHADPSIQPMPRLEAAMRDAETAEFVTGSLDLALREYRHALTAASSEAARGLVLMRIGRTLFKLRRFDEALAQYRAVLTLPGVAVDSHGIPHAVNALLQITDGLDALGRTNEKPRYQRQLLQFVVDHPWDLEDGYGFYLARAAESAGTLDLPAAGRARGLTDAVRTIQWIRSEIRPTGTHVKSGVTATRVIAERNAQPVSIALVVVPGAAGDASPVILGYEIRPEYVAGAMLGNVLKDVDLGTQMRVAVMNLERLPKSQGVSVSRPAPLARAELEAVLRGWSVALFHRNGRSIEQLVVRERWVYSTLIGGLVLVLMLGVIFTMRASVREAELSRLKTEFVSNVSHELKTPLALIRMFGETLESGIVTDEGKRQEFYAIIRRESERLTHLINNVLDVARIDAGTKQYELADGDVVALVREAIDAYQPLFDRLGFAVDAVLPESPVHVSMDRDAIAQAVVNLFQNAIEYSGELKRVSVSVAVHDGAVRLSVADQGVGIRHEEISRIFEKHYRIRTEDSAGSSGSGLGLAIVKHAMEAHGGRVEVESTPERGSVFTLVVPVRHAEA